MNERYNNYLTLMKGKPMDREIERLLKLSSIPGFKLLPKEQKMLDEWKKQQVKIEPVKPKRQYNRRKKTTNEVKEKAKETGILEVES